MVTVWVVTWTFPFEGHEVLGVFSTEEAADAFARHMDKTGGIGGDHEVTAWTLDQPKESA
jgi:hypothetical protein